MFAWPQGHPRQFRDDLLTAEPEFMETEIGEEDEFLLIACDGLWDVLGKQEAVDHAKNFLDEASVFCVFICCWLGWVGLGRLGFLFIHCFLPGIGLWPGPGLLIFKGAWYLVLI